MRRSNYDLLRIFACYCVCLGHVSGTFIETFVWDLIDGIAPNHPLFSTVYTALCRFSVPAFIMLSGAFLLRDERTGDVKTFYRRSFWKIGPPAAICIVFSLIYSTVTKVGMDHLSIMEVIRPLLMGAPYYHLWYLPVLFGLYLLAPFIYGAKEKLTEGGFKKVAIFMVVFGNLALYMTGPVEFHWNIGEVFCYAGYFMMGAVLYSEKSNPVLGLIEIAAAMIIECFAGYALYKALLSGMDRALAEHYFILSYTPFTAAAVLLVFAGFGNLDLKRNYVKISSYGYEVYLIHAFVLDVIVRISRALMGQRWLTHLDARIAVPLLTLLVYLLSLGIAMILRRRKTA